MAPHTCFGGCSVFDGDASPVTAQAVDEVIVYLLPKAEAIAKAKSSPVATKVVMRIFAGRLNHLTTIVAARLSSAQSSGSPKPCWRAPTNRAATLIGASRPNST